MKTFSFAAFTLAALTSIGFGQAPGNSKQVIDDDFERPELGSGWHINTGEWKIVEGALKASEIPADKHSAAARRAVVTGNAVYEFRFRMTGDVVAFHFGFDPAAGQLDKKGHLFSAIVTPQSWKILKHVDKARPKEDPNETLAEQKGSMAKEEWHTFRMTTWGPYVSAQIDGNEPLRTSHPTFGVTKPALVFRCLGDGVEIDDLKVWVQKSN